VRAASRKQKRQQGCWRYRMRDGMLLNEYYTPEDTFCQEERLEKSGMGTVSAFWVVPFVEHLARALWPLGDAVSETWSGGGAQTWPANRSIR
jgi:hypothetical protein